MQVHEVPSYEEFFGLVDNEITDEEFDPKEEDERIKKIIAVALSLLQEFYIEHRYDSLSYIVSEDFESEMNTFNENLKELLVVLFSQYILEIQAEYDIEYSIPAGVVESTFEIDTVLDSAVDTVTQTLYVDLKNKAEFYKEVALVAGVFSLHANFRRAIKRLTNHIKNNAQYTRNVIEREYLSFVYGQEALFYWKCSGINTCNWCYSIEAMGAMPLSWFPVDHPNGRCWLEPAEPDKYSDEYNEIRGW